MSKKPEVVREGLPGKVTSEKISAMAGVGQKACQLKETKWWCS